MPVHNADIARAFDELADLLELQEANPFRIRAYRNAARSVGDYRQDLAALLAAGQELPHLPSIGPDLAAKIREIAGTGTCALLAKLRREIPPAVTELLRIPGLGPKRVNALWHELDVESVDQLRTAARAGRIQGIPGFGERTEARILQSVEAHLERERRIRLASAEQYAEPLAVWLRGTPGVEAVDFAGSYRRRRGAAHPTSEFVFGQRILAAIGID